MTEVATPADSDLDVHSAANAAKTLIEHEQGSHHTKFAALFANHAEKAALMGQHLHHTAQAMMKRYPVSHATNIAHVLNTVRTEQEPASLEDLRDDNTRLSAEEITHLGERRMSNPVLSVARIPRTEFARLAELEPKRGELAGWLDRSGDPLIDQIATVELCLFNDTTELAVGEALGTDGEEPARWVLRCKQYSDEKFTELQEQLAALEGFIPRTHLLRDGEQTLALAEWVSGQHVSLPECDQFSSSLRARSIDPNLLDIHQENIMRQPDGRLLYVDGDYLHV